MAKTDSRPAWLKEHGDDCQCIACHNFKADTNPPIYIGNGKYVCPNCLQELTGYKSMAKHMGKIANIPATCKEI